ncbi:HAD family phosphatase [Nocardioides sp. C4-1]|uniref:HAD family hydrolase n=1 Tax=Nocardioides sp. C4-1 TaxID=3151851 RepID=UPI0032635255
MTDDPTAGPSAGRRPAAVLWDMDGTLVDTEPYWIATEHALAEEHGGTWDDERAMQLVGSDLLASGRFIREHMPCPLQPEEIVEYLLDGVVAKVRESVPWRPGARELLADLRVHGVRCALVTMSYQRFVAPILEHLDGGTFEVIVTGEQVSRGKPDPEPYLRAAELLGVDARDCVAVEDSETGTRSAVAAGCAVVVVPHHVPVEPGERRTFATSLTGLTSDDLLVGPV